MRLVYACILFAAACHGDGKSPPLAPGTMATDPVAVTERCIGLPMDSFSLNEAMTIEGDILKVTVQYGGGCEEHTFAACWDGSITKSDPSSLTLTFAHDAHDDLCDAFITRDLFIDITELPDGFVTPTRASQMTVQITQLARQ